LVAVLRDVVFPYKVKALKLLLDNDTVSVLIANNALQVEDIEKLLSRFRSDLL
jgi:hypothetical protein